MAATNILQVSRRFLTRREAAEYLGISAHAMDLICFNKKLRYYRPSGKQSYFDIADLDAYIMGGEVVKPCPPEKIERKRRFGHEKKES